MSTETAAAFARRLGVHRSSICRAIHQGRLLADAHGRLDIEENIARWNDSKTGLRPDVEARNAANRISAGSECSLPEIASPAASEDPSGLLPEETESDPKGRSAATARVYAEQLLAARNAILSLRNDLCNGRIYRLADVLREFAILGGALRSSVERLVAQLSPELCGRSGPERCEILRMAMRQIVRDLRKRELQAARRLRSSSTVRPEG